ncbi:hypothetical protein RSAG8_02212, partial [Rhizoctonia solani AG-8 WAC10335]
MFLVSAPPSLSDPVNNPTATPWEHDRLLGLGLEERFSDRYVYNSKADDLITSPPRPSSPAPISSSPTATSITASNFLTPQNLSPSPSGAALPLSATNSPKADEPRRSPSPPPVPPKLSELTDTPSVRTSETLLDSDAGLLVRNTPTEPQLPRPVELDGLSIGDSSQASHLESASSEQQHPQRTSPDSGVPLTSLLFTTRPRLDGSPEHSPVRESRRELSPVRAGRPEAEVGVSQVTTKEPTENLRSSPFPRVHPAHQIVPLRETTPEPSRATSPLRNSSPSRPPDITSLPSPALPSAPVVPAVPERAIPEPSQSSPPTRPPDALHHPFRRVLARARLARVPPPVPPRPRPRSQTTLGDASEAQAVRDVPSVVPTEATDSNTRAQQTTVGHGVEAPDVLGDTHIVARSSPATQPPRPPRPASMHVTTRSAESPSRPASVALHDIAPASQPQSDRLGFRPLPTPRPSRPERPVAMSMNVRAQALVPSRTSSDSIGAGVSSLLGDTHTATRPSADTRPRSLSRPASVVPQAPASPTPTSPQLRSGDLGPRSLPAPAPLRPERHVSANVEAHALVAARIGPDGKLQIIPDAEVIWLDKPNLGMPEPRSGPSGSRPFGERSPPLPSVAPEATAGSFNREPEVNPFEDSFLSPPMVAPTMSRQSSTTSSVYQPSSPVRSHPPLPDPVGEVLGPAHPPAPRPDFDLNVGLIEIQRRRVMKDGRVKLKLSLMGVGVDKCGICLTQFKNNESAVLLPCLHSFHTNCIMTWFVRQDVPACPHCRAPVPQ